MKFLKSLFLKLKARTTLRTYQKPLMVTLIVLIIVNFLILFVGSTIAFIFDNAYYNQEFFNGRYIEAFVTSLKWMISPNSIINYDAHKNLRMLILAAVVVVIEMVLFSGAIIAIVTTSLRKYIDTKSKAKGKIILNNHFVILNWSSKVPDIIYNLMLKDFKENIVILSSQNKEYIENEVKSLFLANDVTEKSKANLIIKEGNPLLRANLEDISIDKAKQIVIMAREDMQDGTDDNILNSDLLNLKIILRLGSFDLDSNCQIVVETDSDTTRGQIENLAYTVKSLKNKKVIPVSFNKKIGQIIAQSIVAPLIAETYLELFSYEGSEFYSIDSKDSIEDYLKWHKDAIPVAKLNKLFVLSLDEKNTTKRRDKQYVSTKVLEENKDLKKESCTIFVIGGNKKSEFILSNLERSKDSTLGFNYDIKTYHKTENDLLIEDIKKTTGLKKVLILSDDTVDEDSYDANVFVTLIECTKTFPKREGITFITELLDSRNLSSVKDFDIHNTIISNKMMSLLICQLVMNEDSRNFFDNLLTVDLGDRDEDFDIVISECQKLVKMDGDLKFTSKAELLSSFYQCFKGKNILIGYIHENDIHFLDSNQDKQEDIILLKEDSFIYIKH